MKGIVVYYSATGNTQKIAKAIHKGMETVLEKCDIASINKINPEELTKYDVLAIGGPVWYFREPANLRLFAYKMPRLDGKCCIPFCTHGAAPIGFFYSLVTTLVKKGLKIIGWNDWYCGVYQVLHMPKPYITDGHPDSIDIEEAKSFGKKMARRAIKIVAGQTELIPTIPKGPKAGPLWKPVSMAKFGPPGMATKADEAISRPLRKVNLVKCLYPTCTICVDNCPVNAFDFSREPPTVKQQCLQCNICERLCPTDAIEVSGRHGAQLPTIKTIDMKKCKYPECKLCIHHCPMNSIDFSQHPPVFKNNCEKDDLCWVICPEGAIEITNLKETHGAMQMTNAEHGFNKLLEDAEKKGKFRRLVPLDKIGWNNPIWKMKKHPRFNIEELYERD